MTHITNDIKYKMITTNINNLSNHNINSIQSMDPTMKAVRPSTWCMPILIQRK